MLQSGDAICFADAVQGFSFSPLRVVFLSFFFFAVISKRGVIFGCDRELERSSIVRVHLPSGLQSEEGPLPSLKEYTFSFRVFPKLRVTGHNLCFHTLHPLSHNFVINFSNKIYDPFEPALYPGAKGVTIKPEPGLSLFRAEKKRNFVQNALPGECVWSSTRFCAVEPS